MTTKKRNPNDSTFRNIRALKKRCKKSEDRLKQVETRLKKIEKLIAGCKP